MLDPVPLLISSDEWTALEAGLAQRAELLNLILADLYGPRRLLRKGLVPPELVYGHRGFLRQADDIRLPGGQPARSTAPTSARDARDDPWRAADFAQAPSGWATRSRTGSSCRGCCPSLYRDAPGAPARPVLPGPAGRPAASLAPGVDDSPRGGAHARDR